MSLGYLDTSALAKWYLPESRSEEVDNYIRANAPLYISSLTRVEMRCLLARRRRQHDIEPLFEQQVFATFEQDIQEGFLIECPINNDTYQAASLLIGTLGEVALRTLDVLHLAVIRQTAAPLLVTADKMMGDAALAMGIEVCSFA